MTSAVCSRPLTGKRVCRVALTLTKGELAHVQFSRGVRFSRHRLEHLAGVVVCKASSPTPSGSSSPTSLSETVLEVIKLLAATAMQILILLGMLWGVDKGMHSEFFPANAKLGNAVVWILMAFLSRCSRLFTVLNASRPQASMDASNKGFGDRQRPEWCPPPLTFPIVWTVILLLRATATVFVWRACGSILLCLPIVAFVAHLSIGDTWNYINNARAELGFSAFWNTALVWTSAAVVTALYFQASARAGYILLPMNIWLTVAMALIWSIWNLNGRQSLLPSTLRG